MLATNSHDHEWEVVVPRLLRQHRLESTAWQVLQVMQARPPPLGHSKRDNNFSSSSHLPFNGHTVFTTTP